MTKSDWDLIQEIYHEAQQLPAAERRTFVEKAAQGNTDVVREVLELLSHENGTMMDPPISFPLVPVDDLLGETIDSRYCIEKELGRGGMGRIYLAQDKRVNKKVVIKVLLPELLDEPYARQKFEQESIALSRIRHPGVVEVNDKGKLKDGRPYFVMPYIDGVPLRSQIRPGGMNPKRAAAILRQIGAALEHVHDNGIFHRDLKPENIMLRRGTDSVVLIDFGIAKVKYSNVGRTTTHRQSAGTINYMSPEQLRGNEVTAASDIYSMGIIAYEMITGSRPFEESPQPRFLKPQEKNVREKSNRLNEKLPARVEAIILRALSVDPGARYRHASEFGNTLARALKPSFWPIIARVALVLLGIALISFGVYKVANSPKPPNRSFTYQFTVQRMQGLKPFMGTFKSHGEDEIYNIGDQFKLTVTTPVPAFLYIFNEGPPEDPGDARFTMVFPNQKFNNGSASLGANQSFESDPFTFRAPEGAQNIWFVWSTTTVPELDAVISEAAKHPKGGLTGQTLVNVRQFLTAKKSEIKAGTWNHDKDDTAVVRGPHDLLVALAELKYR